MDDSRQMQKPLIDMGPTINGVKAGDDEDDAYDGACGNGSYDDDFGSSREGASPGEPPAWMGEQARRMNSLRPPFTAGRRPSRSQSRLRHGQTGRTAKSKETEQDVDRAQDERDEQAPAALEAHSG